MTNRLLRLPWATPALPVLCLLIFPAPCLQAQQGFFNFIAPNPSVYPARPWPDCWQSIAGANVMPTVTPVSPGAVITVSVFNAVASGYQATDQWLAPITLPVVWHVEDNQGHAADFNFGVTFQDATAPQVDSLNAPSPTASYGSIVQVPSAPDSISFHDCSLFTVVFFQTTPPDTCEAGVFTRTWTATDIHGKTSSYTQTITISADVSLPTITVAPQSGAAPCAQLATAYPAWLAQQMSNFTATDVSGIKSYTNNAPAAFPPGCAVPITVTFKVTDNCSQNRTATAVFSTSDNAPPVIVVEPKDTVAYCSPNGNQLAKLGEWIHQRAYMSVVDSCTPPSMLTYTMKVNGMTKDSAGVVAAFLASYANGCGTQLVGSQTYNKVRGTVGVDFFVADACGNSIFAGQAMFGAIDTLPPVITGVAIVEQCGGNDNAALQNWINAHGNATVTDECSSTTWTNFSYTSSDGQSGNGIFGSGPYPAVQAHNCSWYADVTFRATDECGNTGSKTLRFQIQDTLKPIIAGFPPSVTLYCPNPTPTLSPSFVLDNCDNTPTISFTATGSDTLCPGSYTLHVTWKATDDCGNTGTALQTVLVRDTTGPVFTLVPPNTTFRCDTFVLPPAPVMGVNITATDNCGAVTSITTQDVSLQNPDPAACGHYMYDIIRTFTATDECGNTRRATQVISIIDNLPPVPGGLLDTTMVCEALPFTTPPPAPSDACSGPTATPVFVNDNITAGPCDDTYTITRNWEAQDVCGNTALIAQIIHVTDTVPPTLSNIPPDVTVECNAIPPVPDKSSFISDDNCDESVTITFEESEIRNPDTADCNHWTNYAIRREWTATDNCGNARTYTQNISVQDNTGPVITPVPLVMLPADAGVCGANVGIPAPISLFDECTFLKSNILLKDTSLLVNSSGGPNNSTPVDTVVFQWSSPNMPPDAPALDPVTLKIYLDNADIGDPTEYFRVYGEGNYLIGQTAITTMPSGQCGSSTTTLTIPAAQLNNWLTDGQLILKLAPNGSGTNAVNALAACAGSRARSELSYQAAQPQVPLTLTFSLDGDTAAMFPPSAGFFLEVGTHTVVYTATDCAGNSTTASTTLKIEDLQPPVLTPPAPDTFFVGQNNCVAVVTLPFPGITDNCDVSGHLVQASANLPLQFENDPNAGLIPKDITLNIPGLIPNAVTGGVLEIRHKGDNGDAPGGEFFRIYDENNAFLSATSSGTIAGQCTTFHETVINVNAAQINTWAAFDGMASLRLEANDDAGNYADFINPCAPLLPDMTDGTSRIQAVLEYSFAVVAYEIRDSGGQLVRSDVLLGNETTDTLPPGVYTVKYLTEDVNGLEGTTSYAITVLDTVKPKAICQSQTIFVNPSGLPGDIYNLQASEIDNGSSDNCSLLTYQLSQSTFSCSQAGNNYTVVMTVTDAAGNSASCSAIVSVQTTLIQPTYNPVCEGGTLQLFANPPTTASTYIWTGPCGFSSNLQNPVISPAQLCHEGTYCVTVTGLTGCTATGCITVDLANLPIQPVISANGVSFCTGDNIVLATPTYGGQVVTYQWYVDSLPAPILLGTTGMPIFTISQPPSGTYRYFVKVLADGCASVNSNLLTVNMYVKPVASVVQSSVSVCECEAITLGTSVSGPGIKYMWTGPSGFTDTTQFPLVTTCAQQIHEGVYTLVIKRNGCLSNPVTVNVDVREKAAMPLLAGATQVCEGATVTLICSSDPNAAAYEWQSPSLDDTTTFINSLILTNVMVSDSGSWRVRILKQGCYSEWSLPQLVQVQAYPDVTATANSPLCQGSTLQLSATSDIPLPNWNWTGPGGFVVYEQNPTRNPVVGGMYKVVGKTSFGCADSAVVDVQMIVPPVIHSVTNTAPLCADGSAAVLQCVVFSQNPPLVYQWAGPMGFSSFNPTPVIPNVSEIHNGTYTVTVYDKYGCMSMPKSTVVSVQDPPDPLSLELSSDTVCAGTDVTISVTNPPGNNVIYTWFMPNGDTLTTQPFLMLDSTLLPDAGQYFVIAAVDGCASDSSAPATLVVNPVPVTPAITANTPLCEGDTLKLSTPFVPNATYLWTGPAGFSATVRNPIIAGITLNREGVYNVQIKVNDCWSALGEGIFVDVVPKPKTPNLQPAGPVCLEQPGAELNLQIFPQSAEPGAQYTWFYNLTKDTIGGPGFPISFQTTDFSQFKAGLNEFYVIANENGCNSLKSNVIQVQFDTIPANVPFAGLDDEACSTLPIELKAANPAPATGVWTQVGNFPGTIVNPNKDSTQVTSVAPGEIYQFKWTLSNGGCKNYASDTVSIETFAPEQSLVEEELLIVCYADSVQLQAIQGSTVNGYWTQDLAQIGFGIYFVDANDPNTVVKNLPPGNTLFFYWNLDNGACGISSKRVTVVNLGSKADAGEDQVLCRNDSCTTLQAAGLPNGETGQWYSDDPALNFGSPTSPVTTVCNLKRGENRVYWRTNGGFCGPESFDTVLIVYDLFPTAVPDTMSVDFGTTKQINVLTNDILPQQFDVTVTDFPDHGNLTELSEGVFSYQPDVTFSGEDVMIYKICNLVCPVEACSTAIATFIVGKAGDCVIFNVITPNDDGANDFFFVPCLERGEGEPDNEVAIFNQYGDVVFHASPYDNNKPWDGTYNGQELPAGTYFYVVKFNGENKPVTGFLQLQR